MPATKAVGRNAAALKYDLLTALGATALSLGKGPQRLILRLMTLITARYNWARDELAVGQREIAVLWSCDERTVKREMAKLRAKGWLVVRRQGVRGRVTLYRMDIDRILEDTQAAWPAVGPDFALRMGGTSDTSVVPLPVQRPAEAPDVSDGDEWSLARAILHGEDPAVYASWIAALTREGRAGGWLTLRAPSRFHGAYVATHLKPRLLAACRAVDADVNDVAIIG